MDTELLLAITSIISSFAIVAFPKLVLMIRAGKLLSDETIKYIKRDEKIEKQAFTDAKEAGLKKLADHINKNIDPITDFYKM